MNRENKRKIPVECTCRIEICRQKGAFFVSEN